MSKKEESNDWVYDYIFGKISSPEFRTLRTLLMKTVLHL